MGKLTYQRRSGGGSFKGRTVGDDDAATKKEQQIIDFIERQRQQTLAVRKESYDDQKSVMANEADHKKNTLQRLKTELGAVKYQNIEKRQQTEVAYYRGLAEEADKKADFFTQWSPKLGEAISKGGQGLWDTVSYFRDKGVDDANRKREEQEKKDREEGREESEEDQWGPDGQPPGDYDPKEDGPYEGKSFQNVLTTDQLQQNADTSVHALSNTAQANLHEDGEFAAADEMMGQTFGRSAGTKWWGTYYGRQAASTFEQDWPTIVALAEDNVDPSKRGEDLVEASYYKWLEHKGIAINSIAGKEVTKKFRSKLNALSNSRTQQTLAYRDEVKSNKLADQFKANLNAPAEVRENIMTQWVLHESRKNTYINGTFSPRGSRVINYGQTFDSLVEPMLKLYEWESFDQFKEKVLSLKIINKGDFIDPDRPDWLTQRAHKIQEYEDLFNKEFEKNVKRERMRSKVDIAKRIGQHESNPKYDPNSEEFDLRAVIAGLNSAESEDEKKYFGDLIGYNRDSGVSLTKHVQMYSAMKNKNWTLYAWHRRNLLPAELKYYDALEGVPEFQSLERAGYSQAMLDQEASDTVKKNIGFKLDSNVTSHRNALLYAKQRFDDIVMSTKFDPNVSDSDRLAAIKKQWYEELNDDKGLWATDKGEFIHFQHDHSYEDVEDNSVEVLHAPSLTLEELNQTDLIADATKFTIIKSLIRGETPSTPKVLWEIARRNPNISLTEAFNGQLEREMISDDSITKKYDFKFDEKTKIKATQIDFLRARGYYGPLPSDPANVPAISGYYDANDRYKKEQGKNLITQTANTYLADKGMDYKEPNLTDNTKESITKLYQGKGDDESLSKLSIPFTTAAYIDQYVLFSKIKLKGEQ
tara:strand:+ start:1058 stop:3667 length:2610 start_codon:yes stop_codon:yes gene_type:complete